MLFESGVRTGLYYFAPHGKWSVINFNKIKVKWAKRCQQVKTDDGIWTVLEGTWKDQVFLPYLESDSIKVVIHPLSQSQSQSQSQSPEGRLLVPYQSYHQVTDITAQVPQVRFERSLLECVNPKSIANISVNRQGIYVNRKYRDKIELSEGLATDQYLKHYRMEIYHDDQLIDSYTLNYLS